jgi:tetratricopeptide (TPR) repeat protein
LDHSPRSDDIMANGVYGLHSAEAISERGLQPGDIERLTQLYSLPEDAKGGGSKEALAAAMQKVLAKLQSAGDTGGTDLATGSGGTMRGGNPYIQSAAAGGGTGGAGQHNDPHTTAMRQAMFALQGGKFTECVEILKDVIKTNPRDAQAHYIMAVACVNLRDYAGAQREYEQVLKLAPSGRLAELASAGLSKIKK